MSDQTAAVIDEPEAAESTPTEIEVLKARADKIGLSYHPSIGVDSLKKKIEDHLAKAPAPAAEPVAAPAAAASEPESPLAAKARLRREIRAEALKLVRLRITNLNPHKKDLHGEIFTVANEYIGDVKKFIPYGEVTEDGYHVPNVIYQQLKDRKFLSIKTRKDPRRPGKTIIEQKWVPEFALEVLPPLTQAELEELARIQAAAGGVE